MTKSTTPKPLIERLRGLTPHGSGYHEIGCEAAGEIERLGKALSEGMPKWFAFAERRPERNANVVYWHSSGYPEISDEWRDEYMAFATHWMPLEAPK